MGFNVTNYTNHEGQKVSIDADLFQCCGSYDTEYTVTVDGDTTLHNLSVSELIDYFVKMLNVVEELP